MENKNRYEEELSVLEIVKYNLKHWVVLLVCAVIGAAVIGGYAYKNTKPSVVYYEELQQTNGAFFMTQYNDQTVTERMYDMQQVALSHGAYERFLADTGIQMGYEEYAKMFAYNNYVVTSVVNLFIAFPGTYGDLTVETAEEANALMEALLVSHKRLFDEYMGEDAILILNHAYDSKYTQAPADTAVSTKDLIMGTSKGAVAGAFLGLLLGVIVVSILYLFGTVAKTAKEIERTLEAPVIAYVRKKNRKEEFKKASLYLQRGAKEQENICYLPFHKAKADGAADLAQSFADYGYRTLYVDLSADALGQGSNLSEYLFEKCGIGDLKFLEQSVNLSAVSRDRGAEDGKELLSSKRLPEFFAEMKKQYDRVIINAPDIRDYADAYGLAGDCDRIVCGCGRKDATGTDLYEIRNTFRNNALDLTGVIVYGD